MRDLERMTISGSEEAESALIGADMTSGEFLEVIDIIAALGASDRYTDQLASGFALAGVNRIRLEACRRSTAVNRIARSLDGEQGRTRWARFLASLVARAPSGIVSDPIESMLDDRNDYGGEDADAVCDLMLSILDSSDVNAMIVGMLAQIGLIELSKAHAALERMNGSILDRFVGVDNDAIERADRERVLDGIVNSDTGEMIKHGSSFVLDQMAPTGIDAAAIRRRIEFACAGVNFADRVMGALASIGWGIIGNTVAKARQDQAAQKGVSDER